MTIRALVSGLVVLALAHGAQAQVPVTGVIVDMTKDKFKDQGTLTVLAGKQKVTYAVSEATQFMFFNQVNTWGANFLNEHVGKKVSVLGVPGSKPLSASVVQILLPPPAPCRHTGPAAPPKPARVVGTIVGLDTGAVLIELPNRTPPPPVQGIVSDLSLDDISGTGTITVRAGTATQTFVVTSATRFKKMGVKLNDDGVLVPAKWNETFLSIHEGEMVKVFPRYGAPKLAGTVDILLAGATPPPAIKLANHFVLFLLQPATSYEIVRDGKMQPASFLSLAMGEKIDVLPAGMHSPLAADVRIVAPPSIHGTLVSVGSGSITVKHHQAGAQGKTAAFQTQTVALRGNVSIVVAQGTNEQPAGMSALHPGKHVAIYPQAAPPYAAERVVVHVKGTAKSGGKQPQVQAKVQSTQGVLVSATEGVVMVKAGNAVKQFTVNAATQLQARNGNNLRPALPVDFVPGAKVTVVALNIPPHFAQRIEIQSTVRPSTQRLPTRPVTPVRKR